MKVSVIRRSDSLASFDAEELDDKVDVLFGESNPIESAAEFARLKMLITQDLRRQSLNTIKMDSQYQTIEKLPEEVESIFIKIKEQLEDRSHPLSRIVDEFQIQFRKYVESEIEVY